MLRRHKACKVLAAVDSPSTTVSFFKPGFSSAVARTACNTARMKQAKLRSGN